ncbi:hypothetical protein [Gloeothece citriformis]|nr:hypothetical protein [Gloeothece citriformis]
MSVLNNQGFQKKLEMNLNPIDENENFKGEDFEELMAQGKEILNYYSCCFDTRLYIAIRNQM